MVRLLCIVLNVMQYDSGPSPGFQVKRCVLERALPPKWGTVFSVGKGSETVNTLGHYVMLLVILQLFCFEILSVNA